jgi:hypothetical protein
MNPLSENINGVTPFGLLLLLMMSILTWTLPRRFAIAPLMITICYMPLGQLFEVAGLHIQFFRVLLLIGWLRVLIRRENLGFTITSLDRIFIGWVFVTLVVGTLQAPSIERLTNRLGEIYNALASYFLFRCWMRDLEDVICIVNFLALMIVPLAVSMIVEKSTGRNIFSVFGGVPEFTAERNGELRCQGAFRHPIMAGTYGATLFPMIVGLWCYRRCKSWAAIIGTLSSVVITYSASTSGALLAMISGVIGFILFGFRKHMRLIRWSVILLVVAIHVMMKAPVWYLIVRVGDVTGGTAWHRAYLIDQAIRYFNEWVWIGSTVTSHWSPVEGAVLASDPNMMDITNHYISEGLGGGVWKLGLFLALIVSSYKSVGFWTRDARSLPLPNVVFIWAIGVCLLTHCVSFISVTYFDQIIIMWYWLLAIMAMLTCRHDQQDPVEPMTEHANADISE